MSTRRRSTIWSLIAVHVMGGTLCPLRAEVVRVESWVRPRPWWLVTRGAA